MADRSDNQYVVTEDMFDALCRDYRVVPVVYRRKLQGDMVEICRYFQTHSTMLLHSPRNGRFSFFAIRQPLILTGHGTGMEILQSETGERQWLQGDSLHLLERWFKEYRGPRLSESSPPFYGGLIGYFSYDVVRLIERLPSTTTDDLQMPIFYFSLVSDGIAIDHQTNELYIFANKIKHESYRELLERIEQIDRQIVERKYRYQPIYRQQAGRSQQASFTQQEFCTAVERIIEYIRAGDVFQVNLSLRQAIETTEEPFELYCKLVDKNPSPYMAYMETADFAIVCSSPELLVKVRGNTVETRPIAGTRSRGRDPESEQALMEELIGNEKERAEHIMLVDLERNDLGRVCEYGTVEVNELFALEKYSHVMHLVSNVRGEIMPGNTVFDIIRAVFPGGTITGAPKVRTMEIIEELEPVRRGLYTGSIGWIGFQQDMEFNIVIRTAVFKHGLAYVQAGAGVVDDSVARREYKESLKKAAVLRELLEERAIGGSCDQNI